MKLSDEARAMIDEARKHGCTDVYAELRAKHFRVCFVVNGVKKLCHCAATGSDWRGPLNARRDVRRAIAEAKRGSI